MRVQVDLAGELDVGGWSARHARGQVPDHVPYGLHKLAGHGVTPQFRDPLPPGPPLDFARRARNRTRQMDFVTAIRRLPSRARRTADAVLCWDERTGVPAALLPGPPVVSGATWLDDPTTLPSGLRPVVARSLRRTCAVFCCCEPTRDLVERRWDLGRGKVHRLTMGVDENFYTPLPPPAVPGVVVSVGDDRRRDHGQLIRVMEQLGRRGVDARLELATTQRGVQVPVHVGVLHRRRMEGSILDLYDRGTVVAIALKPCTGVFGITVALEAMACARPVVITANPGLEEYIDDGVTGLLVPPGDDAALEKAIVSLLQDPAGAAAMGAAARRAVEARFTTGRMTAELAALLRSVT